MNTLAGDMPLADWTQVASTKALTVDVREPGEHASEHVSGAMNLPLFELRKRVDELPRDWEIWLYCAAGQRAYFAQRLLLQRGFDAKNLSGGFQTYRSMCAAGLVR